MIIFKDILSGDELFSDAYSVSKEDGDLFVKCDAKMCTIKSGGISADLIGGNASQEEQAEALDDEGTTSGIDIVLYNHLEDVTEFLKEKKDFKVYLKKWAKNVVQSEGLKGCPEKLEFFKKNCNTVLTKFLAMHSPDHSYYAGPHFDLEEGNGVVMIGVWNEDGMGMTMYGICLGIEEEKC